MRVSGVYELEIATLVPNGRSEIQQMLSRLEYARSRLFCTFSYEITNNTISQFQLVSSSLKSEPVQGQSIKPRKK